MTPTSIVNELYTSRADVEVLMTYVPGLFRLNCEEKKLLFRMIAVFLFQLVHFELL